MIAIRYRILNAAMLWAYDNARRLGMSAADAEAEAVMVADFIKWVTR